MKEFKVVDTETGEEVKAKEFLMTNKGELVELVYISDGMHTYAHPKYKALMWTGKKDKDGNKLYEHDMYKLTNPEAWKGIIVVPDISPENFEELNMIGDGEWEIGKYQYSNIVKVGNRYTHPELTEDK